MKVASVALLLRENDGVTMDGDGDGDERVHVVVLRLSIYGVCTQSMKSTT